MMEASNSHKSYTGSLEFRGPSIYDVHTDGEGIRLRWTHADGGGEG